MNEDIVLRAEGLSKNIGGRQILDDCSLAAPKGKLLALIGPSGAGKSTLLQCVDYLITPDKGEIWLENEKLDASNKRKLCDFRAQVGMIFQDFNLFDHLTAEENVAVALRKVKGYSKADAKTRALEELARVGLARRSLLYPAQLSGGQKQRVAIARALASEIIFMERGKIIERGSPEELLAPGVKTRTGDFCSKILDAGR